MCSEAEAAGHSQGKLVALKHSNTQTDQLKRMDKGCVTHIRTETPSSQLLPATGYDDRTATPHKNHPSIAAGVNQTADAVQNQTLQHSSNPAVHVRASCNER
mmetsp:Transcript_92815/g.184235  ORF Transcript_92815/g.184235 Transcript_92815/m.184235 type:complete len:102 (-) Transcript_92815:366-671(-)